MRTGRFLIVILMFTTPLWSQALYYLEQENRIENPHQQESKTILQKVWYAKDKMKTEDPQTVTIIRLDLNKIWILNPTEKTYMEMQLEDLEAMGQLALGMLGNTEDLKPVVTRTGKEKKYGQWKASELRIQMGPVTQRLWISREVDFPLDYYKQTLKAMPSLKQISQLLEKEVDGIPVYTESTMEIMGTRVSSSTELIKVERLPSLPGDFFDLPEGYTKILNPVQQIQPRMRGMQQK